MESKRGFFRGSHDVAIWGVVFGHFPFFFKENVKLGCVIVIDPEKYSDILRTSPQKQLTCKLLSRAPT